MMKKISWRQICPRGEQVHIATIELKRMDSPTIHDHDFFECFLVLEGDGIHITPDGDSPLQPHHLYFVRPEHAHAIRGQQNLVFLNIAFEASLFESIYRIADFDQNHWQPDQAIYHEALDASQVKEVLAVCSSVAANPNRRNTAWLLLSMARILTNTGESSPTQSDLPAWMAQGLARASQNDVLQSGLPALNRVMGRSREHIARSFKQHMAITPTEWLNKERVQRACLLLATTRLSVLEIALDCGFESSSYFHKCFRETMQTTPLKYRSNLMRVQKL